MTDIERLKIRSPDATDEVLEDDLESAKDVILSRCFVSLESATDEEKSAALSIHREKVIRAAVVIHNMRCVEGETAHSENGVSRSSEASGGLKSILEQIVPRCHVL